MQFNVGLPKLGLIAYPPGQISLRHSSRPLFPPCRSGAGMSQRFSYIFPATIFLAAPKTMFLCLVTSSDYGMVEEVNHTKLHQQISDLLTEGVLGLYVGVEVP